MKECGQVYNQEIAHYSDLCFRISMITKLVYSNCRYSVEVWPTLFTYCILPVSNAHVSVVTWKRISLFICGTSTHTNTAFF